MASKLAGVRASLRAILAGLVGIGQVQNYVRLVEDEKGLREKFSADGRLHAWMVTLADSEPYTELRKPASHALADYKFDLHGYLAVDDKAGSELEFADEVERIVEAFRADANKTLGGTVIDCGPAQWVEGGYRMFAGVLCHYARLSVRVREQVQP